MFTFCSLCFLFFLVGFVVSCSVGLSLVFNFFFIKSLLKFYGVCFDVSGCFNRIFYVHWAESVG